MKTLTLEAIFEKGAFRPLIPLSEISILEGQPVRLKVESLELPNEVLQLATGVYEGLSESEITEMEQIILNRERFFDPR